MPDCYCITYRVLIIAALVLISTAVIACRIRFDKGTILLFTGTGTSSGDVAAVETILKNDGLSIQACVRRS